MRNLKNSRKNPRRKYLRASRKLWNNIRQRLRSVRAPMTIAEGLIINMEAPKVVSRQASQASSG